MMNWWLGYFLKLFSYFPYETTPALEGSREKIALSFFFSYYLLDYLQRNRNRPEEVLENQKVNPLANMADKDKQVALADSGNLEIESEHTSETTLSEVAKDFGHTKSLEKTAKYESNKTESLVEDHRSRNTESSKQVVQSEYKEVSENRQVTKSSFSTSQSYSMEETEEYEIED